MISPGVLEVGGSWSAVSRAGRAKCSPPLPKPRAPSLKITGLTNPRAAAYFRLHKKTFMC